MDLTVHIPDEAVPALKAKASGLPLETFAEQVLLERIRTRTPKHRIRRLLRPRAGLGHLANVMGCPWAA